MNQETIRAFSTLRPGFRNLRVLAAIADGLPVPADVSLVECQRAVNAIAAANKSVRFLSRRGMLEDGAAASVRAFANSALRALAARWAREPRVRLEQKIWELEVSVEAEGGGGGLSFHYPLLCYIREEMAKAREVQLAG